MATRLYSAAELDQLRRYPDAIPADELIRFFTLMSGDVAFVNRHRGETSRIGVAAQLCTLPWLGSVPDDVAAAPGVAVARLCRQLGVPVAALAGYGGGTACGSRHALITFARSRRSWAGVLGLMSSSRSLISSR